MRRTGQIAGLVVGTALAPVLYVAVLGWHALRDPDTCGGPYAEEQVVRLALALACVVAVNGVWNGEWGAALGGAVGVSGTFAANFATTTDPCAIGASLLPLGTGMLLFASAVGLGCVAAVTSGCRRLVTRRSPGVP